jgi:hypothetical protein
LAASVNGPEKCVSKRGKQLLALSSREASGEHVKQYRCRQEQQQPRAIERDAETENNPSRN